MFTHGNRPRRRINRRFLPLYSRGRPVLLLFLSPRQSSPGSAFNRLPVRILWDFLTMVTLIGAPKADHFLHSMATTVCGVTAQSGAGLAVLSPPSASAPSAFSADCPRALFRALRDRAFPTFHLLFIPSDIVTIGTDRFCEPVHPLRKYPLSCPVLSRACLESQNVVRRACFCNNRIGKSLIVPDLVSMEDKKLEPSHKTQYIAGHCRSQEDECRQDGQSIFNWSFLPLFHPRPQSRMEFRQCGTWRGRYLPSGAA
jgi:hypothetical protein